MPKSISFQDALGKSGGRKILLLGNGFSIAANSSFNYAPSSSSSMFRVRKAVIDNLLDTTKEINDDSFVNGPIERSVGILQKGLSDNADNIKKAIVRMIAESHVTEDTSGTRTINPVLNYDKCIEFLDHFIDTSGNFQFYTLNYDLTLYWVLMRALDEEKIDSDDGFRGNFPDDLVTWNAPSEAQNIFYLHGALHFIYSSCNAHEHNFSDSNKTLSKLSSGRKVIPDQIIDNLDNDVMPLVVLEGKAYEKHEKIMHHDYLKDGFSKFEQALDESNTSLFVFGCSLSDFDKHIQDVLLNGKCKVFCSTYGTPPTGITGILCTHCDKLEDYPSVMDDPRLSRQKGPVFFCAESANVWGEDGKLAQDEEFPDF